MTTLFRSSYTGSNGVVVVVVVVLALLTSAIL
jgi:hypothetical protein